MAKIKDYIVYNSLDDAEHRWSTLNEAGLVVTSARGSLHKLAEHIQGREIALMLSGAELVLTSITLPNTTKKKLMTLLPFALEESLVEPPADYHFTRVWSKLRKKHHVAYVSKQRFADILLACKEAGLCVRAAYPAVLSLPYKEGRCDVYIEQDQVYCRTDKFDGFTCAKENLSLIMELALADRSDPPELVLHEDIEYVPLCLKDNSHNLLHGEFAKQSSERSPYLWYVSGAILFISVCVFIGGLFTQANKLHLVNAAIEGQIEKIYKQHFPEARSVVAPVYRLQQQLATSKKSAKDDQFFSLVQLSGVVLSQFDNVTLRSLAYSQGQLRLVIDADEFATLSRLIAALQAKNLNVSQSGAQDIEGGVHSTLLLTERAL